jgi:hypothetical protein
MLMQLRLMLMLMLRHRHVCVGVGRAEGMRRRGRGQGGRGKKQRLVPHRRGLLLASSLQRVDEIVKVDIDVAIDTDAKKARPAGPEDAVEGEEDVVLR